MIRLFLFLFFGLFALNSYSAVVVADTCSYADVLAAYNAASAGDTVSVPAGSCTWSTRLIISKSIKLVGAGMYSTVIKNGIATSGSTDYCVWLQPSTPADDPVMEVSNFTFDADNEGGCIGVQNTSDNYAHYNFRIYENLLKNGEDTGDSYMCIRVSGNCFGLIDNNIFSNNYYDLKLFGNDQNSWDNYPGPENLGTRNYLYIEDNTSFDEWYFVLTSGEGSRWVYRYNTVDLASRGYGTLDAHGNTGNDGVVAHEIYENTFTNAQDRGDGFRLHDLRGGNGIVYNNTISGPETTCKISVREEDCCVYPGTDTVTNTFLWNNIFNGADTKIDVGANGMLVEDRDFWDDYQSGGGDYNFTFGLASARPGSPSDDDSYWETDTKKLYNSQGADNWVLVYEPYTYPHPLRKWWKSHDPAVDGMRIEGP